jgi:hypothetical protein
VCEASFIFRSYATKNKILNKTTKKQWTQSVGKVQAIRKDAKLDPKENSGVPVLDLENENIPFMTPQQERIMRRSVYEDQMTELRKHYFQQYNQEKERRNEESVQVFKDYEKKVLKRRGQRRAISFQNMAREEQMQEILREETERLARESNQSRLNREAIESSARVAFLRRYAEERKHYVTPENLEIHIERQLNPGRVLVPTMFGPGKYGVNDEVALEMMVTEAQVQTFNNLYESYKPQIDSDMTDEEIKEIKFERKYGTPVTDLKYSTPPNAKSDVDDSQEEQDPEAAEEVELTPEESGSDSENSGTSDGEVSDDGDSEVVTHLSQLFPFYTDIMYPYIKILKFDPVEELYNGMEERLDIHAIETGIIDMEGVPRYDSAVYKKQEAEKQKQEEKMDEIEDKLSKALAQGGEEFQQEVLQLIAQNDPDGFYLYTTSKNYESDPWKGHGQGISKDLLAILDEAESGSVDLVKLEAERKKEKELLRLEDREDEEEEEDNVFDWDDKSLEKTGDETDDFERFLGKSSSLDVEKKDEESNEESEEESESDDSDSEYVGVKHALANLEMNTKRRALYDKILAQRPLTDAEREVGEKFVNTVGEEIKTEDMDRWAALLREAKFQSHEDALTAMLAEEFDVQDHVNKEVSLLQQMNAGKVDSVFQNIQYITMNLDPAKFDKLIPFVQRRASSAEVMNAIKTDKALAAQFAEYNKLLRKAVTGEK